MAQYHFTYPKETVERRFGCSTKAFSLKGRTPAVTRSQQHYRIIFWTASWRTVWLWRGKGFFDKAFPAGRLVTAAQRTEVAIVTDALFSIFAFVAFHRGKPP